MKTDEPETTWREWWKAVSRHLADACALSAAAQGGWLPPEPVQREIVARMITRRTATRPDEVGTAPKSRPVFAWGCCGCCVV